MEKKQLHKQKWLVTMLLLVMAILMPYEDDSQSIHQ